MNFSELRISNILINKLEDQRITKPTPIQEKVIPKILKGESVIAQSKTGTGKTLAFLLPLIQISNSESDSLIIAPTNELAKQIYFVASSLLDNKDKIVLLSGGENTKKQQAKLKSQKYNIVIGVPGRIVALVESGFIKLSLVTKVVLDEVDFLIDLGFRDDLEFVFSKLKHNVQVMTFAATLSKKTKDALDILRNQKYSVRITPKNTLAEDITNYFFPIQGNNYKINNNNDKIEDEDKTDFLLKLLASISPYLCIIFVRTKVICEKIYTILRENKFLVGRLHGNLSPSERKTNIRDFTNAKTQYLVATDLAGRGIDIDGITHIINYNLPLNEIDYVHRAGRAGRMHNDGVVYSLCNILDEGYLKKYAYNLDFKVIPAHITGGRIVEFQSYKGVKPRFNLEDMEKQKQIKKSIKKHINEKRSQHDKKRRNKKRR